MSKQQNRLPGENLIEEGLRDLAEGHETTPAALLVLIGAPRLQRLGVSIPDKRGLPSSGLPDLGLVDCPEHALYQKMQEENEKDAHSRYNALIRRLVSYERALESRCRGVHRTPTR